MARRRGRGVKASQQEDDPYINLYIGIVRRAQRDLTMPAAKYYGGAFPTLAEKATAEQFLDELYRSATRRIP